MADAFDVAAYILERKGAMPAMKLHKLLYYSHAWHLVWDEEPLFESRIEAWANGPVIPDIYQLHRQQFIVDELPLGNPQKLAANEVESIDIVLEDYGDLPANVLSDLTHRESPWLDARKGLRPGDRSTRQIEDYAIAEYYDGLYEEDE